jgi:long-chain acyl-CoA synthetase
MTSDTIGELFFSQAERFGSKAALRYKQLNPLYQSMSWNDFSLLVEEIAFGLASLSINAKDTIAIFSPTSYLWVAVDLAAISLGAITVPLYPNSSAGDLEYILNNSEVKAIFVAGEKQLAKLALISKKIESIQKIIYLPSLTKKELEWEEIKSQHKGIANKLIHLNELCLLGDEIEKNNPNLIKERLAQNKAEQVVTIIYTSGTTGTPKGVPLTHTNILSVLYDLPEIIPINSEDTYFSYLPISHVFERVCGEYYWLYTGCTCAFAESIETMAKNLVEVEPTVMVMVPRVLESIYTKVKNGIAGASEQAQKFIDWAVHIGEEVVNRKAQKQDIPEFLKLQYWFADKLVLSKLRERIGKRLRFVVCGGAPASPSVVTFFNAIGIPALEGYGLTETSAPSHVNRLKHVKPGTVGPCLSCVEMKIGEDGEILLKGPSIFEGYFKDPEATKEAFKDGWFATGDVGHTDENGYLKITDRKKDLIVNAAGKNIAPQRIETILKTIPAVSQAVVFGDKNKHLVALLTLDERQAMELAQERGWQYEKYPDLAKSKEMHQYLKNEVNAKRGELAEYEHIKQFSVLDRDLSIDSGELTATMKIKRGVVAEKYADKIESLYAASVN